MHFLEFIKRRTEDEENKESVESRDYIIILFNWYNNYYTAYLYAGYDSASWKKRVWTLLVGVQCG